MLSDVAVPAHSSSNRAHCLCFRQIIRFVCDTFPLNYRVSSLLSARMLFEFVGELYALTLEVYRENLSMSR